MNIEKLLEKLQLEYSSRGINLVSISKNGPLELPNLSNLMKQKKLLKKIITSCCRNSCNLGYRILTRAEIEEMKLAFGTNTLEILMELNWVARW